MPLPTILQRLDELQDRLNRDPEFRLAARHWDGSLALDLGVRMLMFTLADGKVTRVEYTMEPIAEVRIGGPLEGWEKMLSELPPPFYTDIVPAVRFHNFSFHGDRATIFAYHPAIRRLIDVVREAQ